MNIETNLKRFWAFVVSKRSTILLTAGIVTGVTAAVTVGTSVHKADEVLDTAETEISELHEHRDSDNEYAITEYNKDIFNCYCRTGVKLVKAYYIPISLGLASIGMIVLAHTELKKDLKTATAYAGTIQSMFNAYKEKVAEIYGPEAEKQIRYGTHTEIVEENGKEEEIEVLDNPNAGVIFSPYAIFFDELNPNWQRNDHFYNMTFLKQTLEGLNSVMQSRADARTNRPGFMFYNEALKALGVPADQLSKEGQYKGWTYYPNGKNPYGDNYIDFGIWDASKQGSVDFVNGREKAILLEFNLDSDNIIDRIWKSGNGITDPDISKNDVIEYRDRRSKYAEN